VDELRAGGAGRGEALVPVEYEIVVVELEGVDWRNGAIRVGVMYRVHGVPRMRLRRVEAAVEVAAAPDRPADRVDRNRA
jgi:hypothetical protein